MKFKKATRDLLVRFMSLGEKPLKSFAHIPGPRGLPIIGNIWRYLPIIGNYKPDLLYQNAIYNKTRYGNLVREQITKSLTILHLFDSNDIRAFFRQDGKYPHRRSHRALLKYRLDKPHLYSDGGLFPENGEKWFRQRNQFQSRLMNKSYVISNIHKLDLISHKMLNWIESCAKPTDDGDLLVEHFEEIIYRWALGNSLLLFLNLDIDTLEEKFVSEMIQVLHDTLTTTDKTEIQTDRWIKQPEKCPHYKLLAKTQDFLYELVNEQIDKTGHLKPSYLHDWLNVDRIDRRDVVTFIIDALMAGLHTTSYTVAFLLFHISRDKLTQERLVDEIKKHITESNDTLTIEEVDKLTLLRYCMKETFRLNPVSIGTGRLTTDKKLIIANHECPENIMIITHNQVISRDPKVYENPDIFIPERWHHYKSIPREQRPSPFASLPFGFGARACIGQRIAELQIKIMAIRLLQKYKLTFEHEIPVRTTMIHNIDGAISVKLKPDR